MASIFKNVTKKGHTTWRVSHYEMSERIQKTFHTEEEAKIYVEENKLEIRKIRGCKPKALKRGYHFLLNRIEVLEMQVELLMSILNQK